MDMSEYEGMPLPLDHVDYPHEPGRLYNCPACVAECWCTEVKRLLGETECIFCASLGDAGFSETEF